LAFGQAARDAGIAVSMGSKGDCFDNAVAESFFATLKKELVHRRSWPTRRELTSEAFEYIEAFYNRTRRHSTLGYLSPRGVREPPLSQRRSEPRRFAARTHTKHHQQVDSRKPNPVLRDVVMQDACDVGGKDGIGLPTKRRNDRRCCGALR